MSKPLHSNNTPKPARPPPLPPKVPFAASTKSLQEHLNQHNSKPRPVQRGQSSGTVASDSSRDSLRREVNRRSQSLTPSEYNFLQGIVANGTEIEVTLAEKKLLDPSLCFDVNDQEEENEGPPVSNIEVSHGSNNGDGKPLSDPDMDLSVDTAADRQPSTPMPRSPLRDQKYVEIPSAEELYPEQTQLNNTDASNTNQTGGNYHDHHDADLEQTPLVCNLKPQKSLEGAIHLPILMDNPSTKHETTENIPLPPPPAIPQPQLQPRSQTVANPLVGQLWRAHEKGLSLTPQQSSKRLSLRREHSLTYLSPGRRYSYGRSKNSSSSSCSTDDRSLLNHRELVQLKQQQQQHHFRTALDLPWQIDAAMVLRNASTDSSEDIRHLLLPTDEEIFRRSRQQNQNQHQQQQQQGQQQQVPKPPPPRPFKETSETNNAGPTLHPSNSNADIPKAPAALRRMASEGATASTEPQIQRRPSILRRMTSDGTSGPNKSVSFQMDHHHRHHDHDQGQQKQEQQLSGGDTTNATIMPLYHRSSGSASSLLALSSDTMDDSFSTFGSEHNTDEVVRERAESCSSIPSLLHATPIDSPSSKQKQQQPQHSLLPKQFAMHRQPAGTTDDIITNDSSSHQEYGSRRDTSTNTVASLKLHPARPIRDDSITEGSYIDYSRRESMSSIASLNLHIAAPIRHESSVASALDDDLDDASEAFRGPTTDWSRRDSMASIASLHKATPVRQESIISNADGIEAVEAFRQELTATEDKGTKCNRRDSTNSIASLNLHLARPLSRQESICSTAEGADAVEAFRQQVESQRWGRKENSDNFLVDRKSDASEASLNLHKANPIRQDSIASTATGLDAAEAFKKEFAADSNTVKPSWGRTDSLGSVASLNLHKAHPIPGDSMSVVIDILRNQGSAIPEKDSNDSEDDDGSPTCVIPPGKPLRMESITSTVSGKEAKETLRKQFVDSGESLTEAPTRTGITSNINFPSIHHAHLLRSESITSTMSGREAKEALRRRFEEKNAISEWEGTILPDSWEDKKMEEDEILQAECTGLPQNKMSRPVMMRFASASEYDEEGMEVSAVEEVEHKKERSIVTNMVPATETNQEELFVPRQHDSINGVLPKTERRQNDYQHFPNNLVSFATVALSNGGKFKRPSFVDASASFDESKSLDRCRSVFRGILPRSISEDELSVLLSSHCKPKPLSRGQSDATVFPSDMDSESWELETVEADYDGWDVMHDEYAVGYGYQSLPFCILGTNADDGMAQPHVLSPPLMESLQAFFPTPKTSDNFWLKYSLVRDGASLHTLMQHARGAKYSILALETTDGEVFGAFTSEAWRKTWSYFGSGESFLWRMRNSRKTTCFSVLDQAQMESEIDVYPFTGINQCIQLCTHNKIAVGGGSPKRTEDDEEKRDDNENQLDGSKMPDSGEIIIQDHEWGYGLALQSDLLSGTSSPCVTFSSPSLSKIHPDGSLFEITNLELWTLTPCNNLRDAEKLELGKLFLEKDHSPTSNTAFE